MKYWIGVVSQDHVNMGVRDGIMQLGHGKRMTLTRLKQGDWFIYYSPVVHFGDKTPLQAFTALGQVADDVIYQEPNSETFIPFRRKVHYLPITLAPIRPLLSELDLTAGKKSWGYVFRYGLVEINKADFERIRSALTGS